jgi:RNA polymerase sigma-70 factor (ECF subfamily)
MHKEDLVHKSDEELLKLGSSQADFPIVFEILVERYTSFLVNFIHAYINDETIVYDLVQETFTKAYTGISSFRGDASFRTWICQIARNACFDEYKRRKKERDLKHGIKGLILSKPPLYTHALNGADSSERDLWKGINSLKSREREILILHYFEDIPYREIGRIIGMNETTVKVKAFRAVKKLKSLM